MFLALRTYDKQLAIENRGYLIRFGHTGALLLKRTLSGHFFPPCINWPIYSFPHFHHRQHHNYFLGNHYDHTIRWLHYTLDCNFPLWKLKELGVKAVSILGEGGEGALSSERWGEPAMSAQVRQLRATPWCVTIISWPACLLASTQGVFSHSLSPCHSSQVNRPQAMRGNYCTCSCSFASMNDKKRLPLLKIIVSLIY